MVSFMRIYADADGESHFEDLDIPFETADFVPPAPPVLLSPPQPAAQFTFERVSIPAGMGTGTRFRSACSRSTFRATARWSPATAKLGSWRRERSSSLRTPLGRAT